MKAVVLDIEKERGVWTLSGRGHGLAGEPMVFGMEAIIDRYARDQGYGTAFRLTVASRASALDTAPDGMLLRQQREAGGFWYRFEQYDQAGWMGLSGLQAIFGDAPPNIFFLGAPVPDAAT